jgi:hypothetical protein
MLQRQRRRASHIFAKEPNGHYVEPAWCSARLFAVEDFGPKSGLIVDPACGWATILKSARSAGYRRVLGCDVVDRLHWTEDRDKLPFYQHDFLNGDRPTKGAIQSIICNPPFDHVEEFCQRAVALAQHKVAMLILHRRLVAAHWLPRLPIESVYLLTPRPSMPPGEWIEAGNTPGGGTQDFCWLVFNVNKWPQEPALRWLHRDGTKDKRGGA